MDLIKETEKGKIKHEYRTLFIIGCLIGVLSFLCIYGYQILDFTYTDWLMNGDIDLRQHFLGWCHYRASDWHMPIGLIDTLSAPTSVSVIWTDSIPLFAVIFKLFRGVLPEMFQYFGLFGIVSFALQGGISILLVRRYTDKKEICILSVPFFTLSFTLIQRMYYHTALGAQWILLLALLIWFYDERMNSILKRCAVWAGMGFLCVSIHSYFVPMVGIIMLGALIDDFLGYRIKDNSRKLYKDLTIHILVPAFSFCIATLLNLSLLGAFYQNASPVGEGIGAFCSNLNTFFNSQGHSTILGALTLYGEFQHEGFAYLGTGILMLVIRILVLALRPLLQNRVHVDRTIFKNHRRTCLLAIITLVFIFLAVFPMVTYGDHKLFGVPLLGPVKTIMNVFRSNGRFIWTPMYLIILGTLVLIDRETLYFPKNMNDNHERRMRDYKKGSMVFLIALALMMQMADLSGWVLEKRAYFVNETKVYESVWEDAGELTADKKHFVFMYDENDWIMDTAYYAYQHDMTQNNYYYARSYASVIAKTTQEYRLELEQGYVREDTVYIFRKKDIQNVEYQGMKLIDMGDHIIGIAL